MYPGQAPVTTQTYSSRTYQSGQPPIDESYGISDFWMKRTNRWENDFTGKPWQICNVR